ncbi:MAG: hypothetical protein Q8K37_00975 [Alphaproteobacteria bacterium]|nr:hypothetical protein [Alphaproteobacteria bacterium]
MRIVLFLLTILSTTMCLAIEPEIVKKFAIEKSASLRELKDKTDNQYLQDYQNICFKFHVSDFVKACREKYVEEQFKLIQENKKFDDQFKETIEYKNFEDQFKLTDNYKNFDDHFMETAQYKAFVARVNRIANETKQKFLNNEMSLVLAYSGEELIGGTYYSFEDDGIIRMQVSSLNRNVGLSQKRFWKQLAKYLTNPKYFPDYNKLMVMIRNTSSEIPMFKNKLKFRINKEYTAPDRDPNLFTAYERKFKKINLRE